MQRDYRTHDRAAIRQHPVGSNKRPKDKIKMSSRSVQGALEELSKIFEDIRAFPRQPQSHIGEKRDKRQQSCGSVGFPPCQMI